MPTRPSFRTQAGFSMLPVITAMLIMMSVTFAALAASDGDSQASSYDQDRKAAYAAAEAGVNEYLFRLSRDNAYWAKCTTVPAPALINQPWSGVGADPRAWRYVPDSNAKYTIELLPTNGYSQCDRTHADASMIDTATRTLRIRVTGRAGRAQRSIVGVFRRRGFLDFLYLTDYETQDPVWYIQHTDGAATNPNLTTWASDNCDTYWRDGRGNLTYTGKYQSGSSWINFTDKCTEFQFLSADHIDGPFHTNDSIMTCAGATFGRNAQDRIELSAPPTAWRPCPSGGGAPNSLGTWTPNSPLLTMPPSNSTLKTEASANGLVYTGKTTIQLQSGALRITKSDGTVVTPAWPTDGVIYVQNGACGVGYNPYSAYSDPSGCANVYVNGDYTKDLTIASEKDIIVNGNIRNTADALLGLIANNFVRVYHPVSWQADGDCNGNSAGYITNVRIDASILTLQHSFAVDNYNCGSPLGTLQVNGAIAQRFRGAVGTGSGSTAATGFVKDYNYDDRLAFRSPPYFLDPVQSAWRLLRQTEQIPATRGP